MTFVSVLLLVLIPAVAYLVTQGIKAIAKSKYKVDISGYAPNIIAGATALVVYFAPQIAALIPPGAQAPIIAVVIAALGITSGSGVHSTIARLSPTETPPEDTPDHK